MNIHDRLATPIPGAARVSDREPANERFRRTAGRFPTGVTLLTTVTDGQPHGLTVNAFTTVSLAPLLVLASLRTGSRTYHHVRRSGVFAVTVLGAHQERVARLFADPNRPEGAKAFQGIPWRAAPHTGCPILSDGLGYFDCAVERSCPAGDHTVLIGAVRAFDLLNDRTPLLFVRSEFGGLSEAPDSVVAKGER